MAPPLLWLGLAGLLLLLVLVGADLDGLLLIGGLAALLLTLVSGLLPLAGPLQVLLYALLAAAGYAGLRLASQKRAEKPIRPGAGAELAEVIEAFDSHGEGRVRWQGQSWAAQNIDPQQPLPPGSRVSVLGREGTRLQVLPRR
ncbi:MAG: NfeD family protein [Synechococcaceae cyanobacterium]